MLTKDGFDLWADEYDNSVGLAAERDTYPFAGYKVLLNEIYNRVLSASQKTVLDIGFGTGTLSAKLYAKGCSIFGQDFSERMIALAQAKMPLAKLYQGDLSQGLVNEVKKQKYDVVIATYSLHHLADEQKVRLLNELLTLLNDGGCIYVGDIAFETRQKLEECRAQTGDEWDDEEHYFVFEELKRFFPKLKIQRISCCAGLLSLPK